MKPTLVLLPGMDGTGDLFSAFVQALPPDQPVQVVRYPTHEVMGYDALLAHVASQLPSGPYVLLGESFSGPLALRLAATQPAALLGLVLVCTFAQAPVRLPRAMAQALRHAPISRLAAFGSGPLLLGLSAPAQCRSELTAAIAKVAPHVLSHRTAAVLQVDVSPALPSIRVPVLDLRARQDRLVPSSAGRVLRQRIAQLACITIDGPHALLQVRPREAAAEVQRFVQAQLTAASSPHRANPPTAPGHRA